MPSTLDHVNAFTVAMRTEFMKAMADKRPVTPAPWEAFTTKVTSTGRSETHGWMSPPPRLQAYIGSRRYANVDISKYELENIPFDAGFYVPLDDIADIQTPEGYGMQAQAMAADAANFPGRQVIKKLVSGTSDKCFDGTAFFADSHTIGTGDNLMTANNASNDGVTHKIIALYHGGTFKPALWQDRDFSGLLDNADTKQSKEEKKVKFWLDYRGAAGYGFWWDAIHMTITDTPTMAELDQHIADIVTRFGSFYLEKPDSADDAEYIHEQTEFDSSNFTLLCNVSLYDMLDKLMNLDMIVVSGAMQNNIRKGKANVIKTAYLGT